MFSSKKWNAIISVIIAVILWGYVVGVVDPSTTKTVSGITVTLTGLQRLSSRGLAVEDPGTLTLDLKISGKRSDVIRMDQSQVAATASVGNGSAGKNHISVEIDLPKGLEVEKSSSTSVTVQISRQKIKQKKVKTRLSGLEEDQKIQNLNTAPTVINAFGTETQLKKIDHIEAHAEADVLSEEADEDGSFSETVRAVAVDRHGKKVPYIILADRKISVKGSLLERDVLTCDGSDVDLRNTGDGLTATVQTGHVRLTVWGSHTAMQGLTMKDLSIYADLSDLTKGTHRVTLQTNAPDGIKDIQTKPKKIEVEIREE